MSRGLNVVHKSLSIKGFKLTCIRFILTSLAGVGINYATAPPGSSLDKQLTYSDTFINF